MNRDARAAKFGCVPALIHISPQARVLPANILRFYLHGKQPWEAHFDRGKLRLEDEAGRSIPNPFLVLSQELWSTEGRRLTVLLEPGRIKRGMGSAPSHEPALVVGRRYSLVLEALGQIARHEFRVSDAVSSPLDEARWQITPPTVGSLQPISVRFDRVMDTALCENEIAVFDPSEETLPTDAALDADGRVCLLIPRRPWRVGAHRILVSKRFEDVCGNRLGEALDHELLANDRPRVGAIVFFPTITSDKRGASVGGSKGEIG